MKLSLSRLKKIDLREVWNHEALDFTNWLAQEENLDLLSQEIGVEISLIQIEAYVGKFNVDILAEEEASGRKIIIENQLENTNHDHLGKIITYAAGHDAEIIIWVVKDVRDEHQKAIEWLNEHTDENISFFLLKIELWQIEGSNPAPKFEIIVSPNEWAKAIKSSPIENQTLTNTRLTQLEFWNKFKDYVTSIDTKIRLQTPRPNHWYDISIGYSGAHIALTLNTRKSTITCEIYISQNKDLFNYLLSFKENIEKEIGNELDWIDAPVASRIKLQKDVPDLFDQNNWPEFFNWLYKKTVLSKPVFCKYIKEYKL